MTTKVCLYCEEEFDVIPSRKDDSKFCSRECYHSGQKAGLTDHSERRVEYVELTCTGCGDKIEKLPSRANKSERQFCDQDCYLDWNSSHQEKQTGRRARLREKEDASCEICGFDRFIELCHIVPSSDGGTYHRNNICMLCPNHHRLLDHGGITSEEISKIEEKVRKAICNRDGWEEPEETDTFFTDE